MTDYFALLSEPRRPWLEEEELKAKFLAFSSDVHPDRAHGLPEQARREATDRYTELNAAYQCLREPRDRLRHLLELATGRKPAQVQEVPPDLVELFFKIGDACRDADAFLKQKASVTSPLLLVETFEQAQELSERLRAIWQDVNARQQNLHEELRKLDEPWEPHIDRVESIYSTLSYLNRWGAQLQERIVQLTI